MKLSFTKMNGAGNDFVMLDNRHHQLSLSTEQIARLCDRHRGIGADGLLAVELSDDSSSLRMRYYNSDGGEAEMCGNGARCFARFAASLLPETPKTLSFFTQAGVILAELFDDHSVELQMSDPHSYAPPQAVSFLGRTREIAFLNTGVPHAVAFVDDLEVVAVQEEGNAIRFHDRFSPKGTNVNFVSAQSLETPASIVVRTYERGVEAETLACGTGVVASALLFHLRTNCPSPISVRVRGGDTLTVRFSSAGNGSFSSVFLRGPADLVFTGEIDI